MINNKELFNFDQDQEPSEPTNDLTSPEDSEFKFPIKLLYQIIIAFCCLILILVVSHSNYPLMKWINQRLHSAINTSMEDTFGRISKSGLIQMIITNADNLIRLEDITKNINSTEYSITEKEKKIFQNSVWLVQGSITKGYGWRYDPDNKIREFNSGVEMTAIPNAMVLAIADGVITEIKHQPKKGWEIKISHSDGWSSTYYYLGQVNVKIGQMVKAGDPIANIGRPNQEKGSIILLEIKNYDQPVDPLSILVS